jgi:hypothetical protein
MWWWYWIIFTLLFGWSWWWLWFRWPWWPWWPFPFPPLPNPPDPPPYDRGRLARIAWLPQVAAAIGGAGAWAVLGPRLAPDGGLPAVCLIAAVGATALGSLTANFAGGLSKADRAP